MYLILLDAQIILRGMTSRSLLCLELIRVFLKKLLDFKIIKKSKNLILYNYILFYKLVYFY